MLRILLTSMVLVLSGCEGSDFYSTSGKGDASSDDRGDGIFGDRNRNDRGDGVFGQDQLSGDQLEAILEERGSQQRKPAFAMLVNDLECGLCHVKINGDVLSNRAVPAIHEDSRAEILGNWLAAETFAPNATQVQSSKGIQQQYNGERLPKDLDKDGKPDFPRFNANSVKSIAKGTLQALGPDAAIVNIKGVSQQPIAITGTSSFPIKIRGEVLVEGDVVISGNYEGIGTIYATGNIYIPANLIATKSAFPMPGPEDAIKKFTMDALGLASQKSILVADIRKADEKPPGIIPYSVYDSPETPANQSYQALEVASVYSWMNRATFEGLYTQVQPCQGIVTTVNGFNQIDAYLYAAKSIAGVTPGVFTLNGGIIADSFHIISGAVNCNQKSVINYDYRLGLGLPILQAFVPYFEQTVNAK